MENTNYTFVEIPPSDSLGRNLYLRRVLSTLEETYKNVPGGCFETKETITEEGVTWRLYLDPVTGEILCCTLWKAHKFGRKIFSVGHNGTLKGEYLSKVERITLLGLKCENYFCESSDKVELLLIREGFQPIPNTLVKKILFDKKIHKNEDGIHYIRVISGVARRKIMFGNPIK